MILEQFSLTESQLTFVNSYQHYGFKDKNTLVLEALKYFQYVLDQKSLEESADLYAELYEEDKDIRELTESAIEGWPE
ncbi:MAG: hypothetical protein AAF639_29995 [Chloroflexota bacterium]